MEKPKSEREVVLQAISAKLQVIAGEVNQAMRMQWCLDNFKGLSTVNKYFSGELQPNKITGEKLLHDMETAIETEKNKASSVAA